MINDIITYHNRGGEQFPSPNICYGKENVMVNKEVWKDCINFPNYKISSFGRIKNTDKGNILKLHTNNCGYLRFMPCGQKNLMLLHACVAETFIGPRPDKLVIDHVDGNKQNNGGH